MFKKLLSDIGGNVAIVFALAAPLLLASMGLAVDYTSWTGQTRKLQGIADIAALAAAKELYLANADDGQITSVANSVAQAQLALVSASGPPLGVAAQVLDSGDSVEVVVTQDRRIYFADMISDSLPPLAARAVARAMGGGRVCVIGLDETASATVSLSFEARITANECGVYSNSTDSNGLSSYKNSVLSAELICSAGGYGGNTGNFSQDPLTDCPAIPDPLIGRPAPDYSGCDYIDLSVIDEVRTLSPGVYCGGLSVYSSSEVDFEPGIYVIKDGELEVTHTSIIRGQNVGFYFTGADSTFLFASGSTVELTAPTDGPMAGLLFFEDRTSPELRYFEITSDNARILVGTIYLPNGIFRVTSKKPVADQSAYTAIVARRIQLNKSPNLVINANYQLTDIPVPGGLGSSAAGRNIVLIK